mmetsp:Transcript_43168/g.115669  ORF Transcript_43168/g.115669 Transcript_43168/m.115669 type:complete len:217 (+) Transcript_43168:798-1448(+)
MCPMDRNTRPRRKSGSRNAPGRFAWACGSRGRCSTSKFPTRRSTPSSHMRGPGNTSARRVWAPNRPCNLLKSTARAHHSTLPGCTTLRRSAPATRPPARNPHHRPRRCRHQGAHSILPVYSSRSSKRSVARLSACNSPRNPKCCMCRRLRNTPARSRRCQRNSQVVTSSRIRLRTAMHCNRRPQTHRRSAGCPDSGTPLRWHSSQAVPRCGPSEVL